MNQPLSPAPSNRLTTPPAAAPLNFALVRSPFPPLAFREVGYGYLPGRTLYASIVGHIFAVFVIVVLNGASFRPTLTALRPRPTIHRHVSVYLPILGGGIGGHGQHPRSKGKIGPDAGRLLAQSGRGFAYPGPQPIVSNPPQARLGTQTILREMKNLPRLQNEIPLPNLVRPPLEVDKAQPNGSPVLKVRSGRQINKRRIERAIRAPKILLSPAMHNKVPDLAQSRSVMPKMAEPEPGHSGNRGISKDQTGLLVLNAIPVPDAKAQVPLAERRSLFAVSPAEATVIAEPGAGTKSEVQTSQASGSASGAAVVRGDALAEAAANGSAANQPLRAIDVSGGGYSDVHDIPGFGSGIQGPGAGRDAKSAEGIGTGSTTGTGSGAGAGSAPGTGTFRGITIQGGRYGNNGSLGANPAPHRQTSYNMTIVSAGHGGGGLPDVGVFHDDKVYTVYLDMRANDDDPTPSWILQYALLQPSGADTEANTRRIRGTPTPPYAMLKEIPTFPREFFRNSSRPLIIASAIMTPSGNLESVSVVQSPAPEFINPILEALQHWMFEPARLDGQAVGLKVLLGIRLAVP